MINMKSIIFKSINIVCVSIFLLLSGCGDVSDIFNKNNSNNSGNTGGNDNSGNTGSNGDTVITVVMGGGIQMILL